MATVWAVSRGRWSDYGVVAIFSTREKAERFLPVAADGRSSYDEAFIEEFALDPFIIEAREGWRMWTIRMEKDGDVLETWKASVSSEDIISGRRHIFDLSGNLVVSCMATDEPHAIKIANELRGQLLALDQWGNE